MKEAVAKKDKVDEAKIEIIAPKYLIEIKNKFNAGDTLSLTIIRDNKYCKIDVVLEEAAAQ